MSIILAIIIVALGAFAMVSSLFSFVLHNETRREANKSLNGRAVSLKEYAHEVYAMSFPGLSRLGRTFVVTERIALIPAWKSYLWSTLRGTKA